MVAKKRKLSLPKGQGSVVFPRQLFRVGKTREQWKRFKRRMNAHGVNLDEPIYQQVSQNHGSEVVEASLQGSEKNERSGEADTGDKKDVDRGAGEGHPEEDGRGSEKSAVGGKQGLP